MSLNIPAHLKELRFLQLTLYTLIFLIITPLLSSSLILSILAQVFILNSLLVSLSAGGFENRYKLVLWSLWVISMLGYLLATFEVAPTMIPLWWLIDIFFTTLLLLSCIIATCTFIFRSRRVTLDTIFAAVVVYLFIAFTFAQLYHLLSFWQPESFPASAQNSASLNVFKMDMVYFSLVTIATLGYGDIVPKMPVPRFVAALEAVIGQFYIAILVAWLVGKFISQSMLQAQTRQSAPNPPPEREWDANRQANELLPMVNKDELPHQD
jgi:voltage-gated potassium channel